MWLILRGIIIAVGLVVASGTLLSLSRHPHWLIRVWDFPRPHLAVLAALAGGVYAVFFSTWTWAEWGFVLIQTVCATWQFIRIFPYTPLAPRQVKKTRTPIAAASLRFLISNVLMENRHARLLLQAIQETDPDLILAIEIDPWWETQLKPLERTYPHVVSWPQMNHYGMALFSRLRLIDPQVEFLVQDDIPSIHTWVELPNGQRFFLHGLHPRPPEPIRDQDATPRDAELVLVGRAVGEDERPTVVAGDLNDVAWSHTTRLFLHLSRLLDPRIGRGFYNTYNAHYPIFRFSLDHVFHSACFTLNALRRLRPIGSDHFPIYIELQYEPQAQAEQEQPPAEPEQQREAQEKIDRAAAQEGPLTEPPRGG
jgi:endonuclease/exonuclease/phosphatase (EEP) superfamily protein YafD